LDNAVLLTRYIYRDIIAAVFALLTVLLLIFLSHRFVRYLTQASMGDLPSEFIYKFLGLKMLIILGVLLPLAFFLAILMTLGRLYNDNEIAAMSACGIGLPFLIKRITLLAGFFALLVGSLSLFLSPWAAQQQERLEKEAASVSNIAGIASGRFKEFNRGDGVFYVEKVAKDGQTMENIFIAINREGKQSVLVAKKGQHINDIEHQSRVISVDNGYRYQGTVGQSDYEITSFKAHSIRIMPEEEKIKNMMDLDTIDTRDLWGNDNIVYRAELQMRLSAPLMLLLLAPLAVLMAYSNPRQGRYAKILTAVLVYFVYGNLLQMSQKWMENGNVPAYLGVWWVHVLLLVLVIVLGYLRHTLLKKPKPLFAFWATGKNG
jgi:lipopolysaccharide export system permease protein